MFNGSTLLLPPGRQLAPYDRQTVLVCMFIYIYIHTHTHTKYGPSGCDNYELLVTSVLLYLQISSRNPLLKLSK